MIPAARLRHTLTLKRKLHLHYGFDTFVRGVKNAAPQCQSFRGYVRRRPCLLRAMSGLRFPRLVHENSACRASKRAPQP
ncbi:hypothetical protein PsYK624_151770 [Phanerochaete sordida]|uniref:Uncharacterized protein n=1 Tax=Phanerochaete sordida TaxID=48140 RepID=A0A9P3GRC4_9APHY|nr:hypothetical protein PsYK624_151770 [Phanerochaete sordida]